MTIANAVRRRLPENLEVTVMDRPGAGFVGFVGHLFAPFVGHRSWRVSLL